MAHRRVRRRHVVEAVQHLGLRRRRRRRPSRRARSATSRARCPRSRLRARSRCAASRPAPRGRRSAGRGSALSHSLLISPARGPCSWWLMPPVPQICTFSVLVDSSRPPCGSPGRASKQRLPDGHRVLHDVDGERDHLARPRLGCAAHQRQRHREAVVDVHLVDDGQVEVLAGSPTARCAQASSGWPIDRRARGAGPSLRRRAGTRPRCRSRRSGSCPG